MGQLVSLVTVLETGQNKRDAKKRWASVCVHFYFVLSLFVVGIMLISSIILLTSTKHGWVWLGLFVVVFFVLFCRLFIFFLFFFCFVLG